MFNKRNNNMNDYSGYFPDPQMQRLFYMLEENTRKVRNLNNRVRRIENYLGLRNDDKYDEDIFSDD